MTDRLNAGDRLTPGQSVTSNNGRYNFFMQHDGNLVLYKHTGRPLWATGTDGRPISEALMQNDGNFVLYSPGGPVWATGTDEAGSYLLVQDDGNVVIYGPRGAKWATNTDGSLQMRLRSFLGAGHYMETSASLRDDGFLNAITRTWTITALGGYHGAVRVGLVDANGFTLAVSDEHRYGVDGHVIGRSDRTDTWNHHFDASVVSNTRQLLIAHYWAPNPVDWDAVIQTGKIIIEVILLIASSGGNAQIGGE